MYRIFKCHPEVETAFFSDNPNNLGCARVDYVTMIDDNINGIIILMIYLQIYMSRTFTSPATESTFTRRCTLL